MHNLISRQQAIDAICEHGTDLERRGITVLAVANHKQATVDLLENLPSAQPERKTGHWILDRSGAYCCSKCMEPCASYVMMKPRDKYCKMCGAKMEGEQE